MVKENKHSFSLVFTISRILDIIALLGTQTSGESTRMEFAQDGFSADFVSSVSYAFNFF